ncbi:hypothetical protein GCM10027057_19690 [Marisediminicola antarctica]
MAIVGAERDELPFARESAEGIDKLADAGHPGIFARESPRPAAVRVVGAIGGVLMCGEEGLPGRREKPARPCPAGNSGSLRVPNPNPSTGAAIRSHFLNFRRARGSQCVRARTQTARVGCRRMATLAPSRLHRVLVQSSVHDGLAVVLRNLTEIADAGRSRVTEYLERFDPGIRHFSASFSSRT